MQAWLVGLFAAALAAQAAPDVITERTGPDAYRLTVTMTEAGADQARRQLLQTAERLCGDQPVRFGRYDFEAHQPLEGAASTGQVTFRQELACGGPEPEPEPRGQVVRNRDEGAIRALTEEYFGALARGDFQKAYAMASTDMHGGLSLAEWTAKARESQAEAGGSEQRRLVKLTWYDNPADAPRPGTYVAVDYTATTEKLALQCGYLVWFHEGEGRFRLVRQETAQLPKLQAAEMTPAELQQIKAAFRCAS